MTKPATPPTRAQLALLRRMKERGLIVVGVLGADAMHPNHRLYWTSDGAQITDAGHHRLVTGLESRQLIKVISTSGEDPPRLKHLTITELGRLAAERGQIAGRKDRLRVE